MVGTAHWNHQHPQGLSSWLGTHTSDICPSTLLRGSGQARGHRPSLLAWIPVSGDSLDFGVCLLCWPTMFQVPHPNFALLFFSDFGLGILTHITVATPHSALESSVSDFRSGHSSPSSVCLCLSPVELALPLTALIIPQLLMI